MKTTLKHKNPSVSSVSSVPSVILTKDVIRDSDKHLVRRSEQREVRHEYFKNEKPQRGERCIEPTSNKKQAPAGRKVYSCIC